jgi:uncharacterized phage protein gp47/JayE
MFDEYTQDYIMERMMVRMPDDIDTSEGSLVHSACLRMAAQLEELYENLSDVYDNILIDGMDLDHLIASGEECGVPIHYATNGTFRCKVNCELEEDTILEAVEEDFTYRVVELIEMDGDDYIYKIEAEDEGTDPNTYLGEVEPEDVDEDFEYGEILAVIVAGKDEEDEDDYRVRRYEAFQAKPFAGNRAYYRDIITQIDGIGAVKLERAASPGQVVTAIITDEDYLAPSAAKVAEVQAAVDPTQDGNGNGVTPIGASVTVQAATETTIDFVLTMTLDTGYTAAGIQTAVEDAIEGYLSELRTAWENTAGAITVMAAKVISAVLDVEGVADVSALTMNGASGNLTLSNSRCVPVRGTVTCN